MGESGAKSPEASPLAGPEAVTINLASPLGPFAHKEARFLLPTTRIWLVNTSANSVVTTGVTLDSLQQSETGASAGSHLTVEAAPLNLAPGESAVVTMSGFVPAKPAIYASTLRVAPQEGTPLAIRVEFRVAARVAWGFACMLIGLSLVGLINVFDSESGILGELHRALLARQSAHEFLEQTPPPQSHTALVENINREFDAAIAILQKPRKLSFLDHRSADAEEHLQTATELTANLSKALSEKPRGSIEVDDLVKEWTELKNNFGALSWQFLTPMPEGSSLPQRLGAFDVWAAQRILRPPIDYYTTDFAYHITQVQLLYGAGRDQDAAIEAAAVRRWMQRAADLVNKQAQGLTFFVQLSANNIAMAQRLRQRVESDGIAADRRAAILASLDTTASLLSGPLNWQVRRKVNHLIEEAHTETLRAEKDALQAAIESVRAQVEKEISIESVLAVRDEGAKLKRGADGKIDPQEMRAWLRRLAAAWRICLATLPDPNPPALRADLDAFQVAIGSNDLDAVSFHSHKLFDQWTAYGTARANSMILRATAPFCFQLRDDILVGLEATEQAVRRLEGNTDLQRWEGELDRLSRKTRATPDLAGKMPLDCLDVFFSLSGDSDQLLSEVDSKMWGGTEIPDVTKHELATEFSASLTQQALANLINDVRSLSIEVKTPHDELYEERQIGFKIANLGPDWGHGIKVAIDFGDHSQPKNMTAEDLKKNNLVTHSFTHPKSYIIAIKATEAPKLGTLEQVGTVLGEGTLKNFAVWPSPISLARQLEDNFFNARFGLALLIAGLLYFWRFHATKAVFGANAFDYAQAFALGFAVSLAINDLPQKLAEFISVKG
jgi:hypothetical protein